MSYFSFFLSHNFEFLAHKNYSYLASAFLLMQSLDSYFLAPVCKLYYSSSSFQSNCLLNTTSLHHQWAI